MTGQDELGQLSQAFNQMTAGLRERADMQKFVSQSTMEMIQSPARHSAGERKHLTILFSDVRGFSRFAEQRPPEHAVEWLNKCLGAQADLVRKHNGDVDKFILASSKVHGASSLPASISFGEVVHAWDTFQAAGFGPPPACDPERKPTFSLKDVEAKPLPSGSR